MEENRWNLWYGKDLIWYGDGEKYLRGVNWGVMKVLDGAHRKILKKYKPKKKYDIGLLVDCTYGKPYRESWQHRKIIEIIDRVERERGISIHRLILSLGVVPEELEDMYPFCAYDWNPERESPVMGSVTEYNQWVHVCKYLEKFGSFYGRFLAYVRADQWDLSILSRFKESERIEFICKDSNIRQQEKLSLGRYTVDSSRSCLRSNLQNLRRALLGKKYKGFGVRSKKI